MHWGLLNYSQLIIGLCWLRIVTSEYLPSIVLDGWSSVDDFQKWNTNLTDLSLGLDSNETVFVIPSNIRGLSMICNASYPIEWTFHREKWGNRRTVWQTTLSSRRETNAQTLIPLWYSLEIRFLGSSTEITGNYTCQKYGQPKTSSSVYVYWEGSSPPFLTLIASGREKRVISFDSKNSHTLRLPCTVSRPDINVRLSKLSKDNTSVPVEDSVVNFDPAIGFTFLDTQNVFGTYRCTVDLEDEDFLDFEVVAGDDRPKPEFQEELWKSASFYYNQTKKQFVCCSSSEKPPKVAHYYCSHPITCQLQKHVLHKIENSARKYTKDNCSMIPLRVLAAGVLRCKGDSIDIVREYFFPILSARQSIIGRGHRTDDSPPLLPYFSWTDAIAVDMMTISSIPQPFYIGQKKRFSCQASPFYFAQGIHWTAVYQNETINVKGNQSDIGKRHPFGIFQQGNWASIELVAERGLKSLICMAPVWNTSGWGSKTVDFTLADPVNPTVDKSVENVNWLANDTDKVLTCKFNGSPRPQIVWTKDGKYIYKNIKTNTTTQISILKIPRVSNLAYVTYICNASNFAGSAAKIFKVHISAGVSAELVALYIVAAVCVIGACIGGFFGIKKMKEQKEAIRRLANVAFKDVSDGLPTAASQQQQNYQRSNSESLSSSTTTNSPQVNGNGNANTVSNNVVINDFFNERNPETVSASDFGRYQKM